MTAHIYIDRLLTLETRLAAMEARLAALEDHPWTHALLDRLDGCERHVAAWLNDCGKVTIPPGCFDKAAATANLQPWPAGNEEPTGDDWRDLRKALDLGPLVSERDRVREAVRKISDYKAKMDAYEATIDSLNNERTALHLGADERDQLRAELEFADECARKSNDEHSATRARLVDERDEARAELAEAERLLRSLVGDVGFLQNGMTPNNHDDCRVFLARAQVQRLVRCGSSTGEKP
jgi:hypothetical protein